MESRLEEGPSLTTSKQNNTTNTTTKYHYRPNHFTLCAKNIAAAAPSRQGAYYFPRTRIFFCDSPTVTRQLMPTLKSTSHAWRSYSTPVAALEHIGHAALEKENHGDTNNIWRRRVQPPCEKEDEIGCGIGAREGEGEWRVNKEAQARYVQFGVWGGGLAGYVTWYKRVRRVQALTMRQRTMKMLVDSSLPEKGSSRRRVRLLKLNSHQIPRRPKGPERPSRKLHIAPKRERMHQPADDLRDFRVRRLLNPLRNLSQINLEPENWKIDLNRRISHEKAVLESTGTNWK
jgi:hypothetical protein